MSSRVMSFILMACLLATAFGALTNGAAAKPNGLRLTCGKPLLQRVLRVCQGPCYSDTEMDLITLACSMGVTDEQLAVLCCPQ